MSFNREEEARIINIRQKGNYYCVNYRKTTKKVCDLVAEAFVEKTGTKVVHINGDRGDNRADNLRWE